MSQNKRERVEWIDTAKGFCILLVVLAHIAQYLNMNMPLQFTFSMFRMPLYFILSGLFFKKYEGFVGFFIRKVNKLIIPYTFWYLLLGVLTPVVVFHLFDIEMWYYTNFGVDAIKYIFSEEILCNPPIWFLSCLFIVNIIFYGITLINKKNDFIVLGILSFICGTCGLTCSYFHMDLPFYLDSSLTAVPFFYFGYWLRNKTDFLSNNINRKTSLAMGGGLIILFIVAAIFRLGVCQIMPNSYGDIGGILQLYPFGIIGSLMILSVSRLFGTIPVISYIGRYSVIVLCTHAILIQIAHTLAEVIIDSQMITCCLTVIFTILACVVTIPVCRRYLGYVTAQKDVINI